MPERLIGAITIDHMKTQWAVAKVIPRLGLYEFVGEDITDTGSFSNEGHNLRQIAAEVSSRLKTNAHR